MLTDLLESGGGAEEVDDRILELEKTMRLTSICGLGQVALGPAISVLGLKRGGTEARPHPRPPRPPDQAAGPPDSDRAPESGPPGGDGHPS
jgi:formate dehydrogenase/NADH-quinone oxidoreductase subunit F